MDWLTIIVTAATVLGVAGAVFNIYKHYLCPILWELSNILLIIYNLQKA